MYPVGEHGLITYMQMCHSPWPITSLEENMWKRQTTFYRMTCANIQGSLQADPTDTQMFSLRQGVTYRSNFDLIGRGLHSNKKLAGKANRMRAREHDSRNTPSSGKPRTLGLVRGRV